ncbi:MAG: phenylacetic acid degradation bifunctional protein PaaZ [Cytophagales bacterium]|nr:MAG: phenylacetic acid degradation bifunctional protein PaaZ [Cytophagales bacterium]TAF59903.1 MAG: phenylacetic acid degradation bifunctional protein PaaZ [Cytophagales bacterium]
MNQLQHYVCGEWVSGNGSDATMHNAITGEPIAQTSTQGIDFKAMLEFGRRVGGPALRKMTFHERARMLKALALHLTSKKDVFYKISALTGATKADSWIDIEGGIGNLFAYASKGRRELPNDTFLVDGKPEILSKGNTFIGHHIAVPLQGVALHINAFNFPCWGMLEKIAVNLLAGVPAIVKPATATSFLTEAMSKEIIASNILPRGSFQVICGGIGDMLNHLDCQDVVTFTGSAATGQKLKAHPNLIQNSVRFNMEADSLNCCILGEDVTIDMPEFDLFIKEVAKEMTTKAGQKCTAIRRTIVPENMVEAVTKALKARLSKVVVGNPAVEGVRMGSLASMSQKADVRAKVTELLQVCETVHGQLDNFEVTGADAHKGAFVPIMLLYCKNPFVAKAPHSVEAFGPVNTILPYKNTDEAIELAKMGQGSLVGSLVTADNRIAKEVVLGSACMHGRMLVLNRHSAGESTGHGSPMPQLVHGGPGRAGGGEEMGGIRGVMHYLQRTAIQGSPTTLAAITGNYILGAEEKKASIHPFRKLFDDLEIGETLTTHKRTVTETDIVNFANVSWDHFYAHTDDTSFEGSVFERRVAHGYFIISAAAGLFVDPGKGPVLANYGLDELRFTKPVYVGDTIYVKLTVKEKIAKDLREGEVPQGVVKWQVQVFDQTHELVALATILTLVQRKG